MSECLNKDIGKKLPAYELGMLKDLELEEFETHLICCTHCRNSVKEFNETSMLMLFDSDVRTTIGKINADKSTGTSKNKGNIFSTNILRKIVPTSILVMAVVIVLILKPWHIEIQSSKEAIAAANRITIMNFENIADPDDTDMLGKITSNLLITDLSESEYVSVISSQSLFDILRRLNIDASDANKKDFALQIAREINAKWLLLGSILQIRPTIVATTQLVDVPTGQVEKAARYEAKENETIFAVVDNISAMVKNDLLFSDKVKPEPDPNIAEITTNSQEAYRYYLEGVENLYKNYIDEALADLNKALELDSTFAMVYYYLSKFSLNSSPELISKAKRFSTNASRKEKYFISSQEAFVFGNKQDAISILLEADKKYPNDKEIIFEIGSKLFDYEKYVEAIPYLKRVIELDPNCKHAFNQIAYAYQRIGDYENAILAIDKYISLDPNEPNPYDSRGDMYVGARKIDKAIESFKIAVSLKSDFYASIYSLANLYLIRGEYENSQSYFNKLGSSDNIVSSIKGKIGSAQIKLHQGKFNQAITILDSLIETKENDWIESEKTSFEFCARRLISIIYGDMGEIDKALREFDKYTRLFKEIYPDKVTPWLYYKAHLLAESGNLKATEEFLSEIEQESETAKYDLFAYWYGKGAIERARGNIDQSLKHFAEASNHGGGFHLYYMMAKTYLELNQPEKAVEVFQEHSPFDFLWDSYDIIWKVKMSYLLGRAYEDSNWQNKAIEQYNIFLKNFNSADIEIQEVTDARARLEKLKGNR